MWLIMGSFFSFLLARRLSSEFHVADRAVFRAARLRTAERLKMRVFTESPSEIVLEPTGTLIQSRYQCVWVTFAKDTATVSEAAILLGGVRHGLRQALVEPEVTASGD